MRSEFLVILAERYGLRVIRAADIGVPVGMRRDVIHVLPIFLLWISIIKAGLHVYHGNAGVVHHALKR